MTEFSESRRVLYLDNAATSFPKPDETLTAMERFSREVGANPGRSGHRCSIEAGRIMFDARETLAEMFGAEDPLHVIFAKNATEALNIAIFGLLQPGDHAVTSGMEHNSVMRPLREMEKRGVSLTVVPCSPAGEIDPDDVRRAVGTDTKAIYLTHASNVTGTLMPVAEIGRLARERDVLLCVDAAQTAGAVPVNVQAMNIDLLAFTGHKSLFGPQGTGGLILRPGVEKRVRPLMMGGTGSLSESEEHPDFLPDRFESGTPNTVGIAGLGAGARFIRETGVDFIRRKEIELTAQLIRGLKGIPGLTLYGTGMADRQTPVVSFNLKGKRPSEVSFSLDEDFGIMSRPGLQCAPAAHRTIGTFSEGTVRLSLGFFNTAKDVEEVLSAVGRLAPGKEGL